MCGIYGFITKKGKRLTPLQKHKRDRILVGLALSMQERGIHSTGIVGVSHRNIEIVKKAVNAREFINLNEFKTLLKLNNKIMIGHTRSATVGDKTDENAHPFKFGNIIGVHNGRITDYEKIYPEAKVDSEAVFHTLNKNNNSLKKSFQEFKGIMALVWINTQKSDELLFMVNGNPLHLVKIPELDTYFFASTSHSLLAITGSYFPQGIGERIYWQPKKDVVYKMNTNFDIKKTEIKLQEIETASISEVNIFTKTEQEIKDALQEETEKSNTKNKRTVKMFMDKQEKKDKSNRRIIESSTGLDLSKYKEIMNFSTKDMQMITEGVLRDGCGHCDGDIDINEGFFWSKPLEAILCLSCSMEYENNNEMIFINKKSYQDIEADANDAWKSKEITV